MSKNTAKKTFLDTMFPKSESKLPANSVIARALGVLNGSQPKRTTRRKK
jgi:hypothetical protein